jgi:choline dehydrogenase-like flavoprotein
MSLALARPNSSKTRGAQVIESASAFPNEHSIDTDICIIGGGAAGLSVAHQFLGTRHRVCLLESGGLLFERSPQRLSRGLSVDLPYEALDLCRIRQFGGSTGRSGWGGWCKELAPEDFEAKPWLPLSGWPIGFDALQPYYRRSRKLLGIDELPTEGAPFAAQFKGEALFAEGCRLSPRPDLGRTLLEAMRQASNIQVLVHATVLRLKADAQGGCLRQVEAASAQSKHFFVCASQYVLASGGIENARLLLLSNDVFPDGIGNGNDLVGRCFMEHPRIDWGAMTMRRAGREPLAHFSPALAEGRKSGGATGDQAAARQAFGLAVKPEVREREQLLNSRTWIKASPKGGHTQGADALGYLAFWLKRGRSHPALWRSAAKFLSRPGEAARAGMTRLLRTKRPGTHYRFVTIMEQEPDLESRVRLASETDSFGLRKAELDWRVGPLVHHTRARVQEHVIAEMTARGHECSATQARHRTETGTRFGWVRHHMGTTRMSDDIRRGVVDAQCRVHGMANLFVAGSSVFPTGGNDMPTLTIIALAMRLGDHLRSRLELNCR